MKDLVSCFSEHAIRISDVACSGGSTSGSNSGSGSASPSPGVATEGGAGRAIQSSATSVYRSCLSASRKHLLVHVTWTRSLDGPALSVAVHDASSASRHRRTSSSSGEPATRHLHKKKGSGTFTAGSCVVAIFWDYSGAKYGSAGPEPVSGFYVGVVADAEFVVVVGDMSREYVRRLHGGIPIAEFWMASRRERFVGRGWWSSKARFWETGEEHEIRIGWCDGAELWVSVDDRRVVQLQRPRWNFRGTHTLFLEGGVPVDMMWDLHGWLFTPDALPSCCALFTFHTRPTNTAEGTSLALEDGEEEQVPHDKLTAGGSSASGFCLLIQAFKTSPHASNIISGTTTHHY